MTGGDWREIYPWQPYPMAFPELLRASQAGGADGLSSPSAARRLRSEALSAHLCRFPQLVRDDRASAGVMAGEKRPVRKVILPFYSHCGASPAIPAAILPGCAPGRMCARHWAVIEGEAPLAGGPSGHGLDKNGVRSPYTANAGQSTKTIKGKEEFHAYP